jgi:putative transposase
VIPLRGRSVAPRAPGRADLRGAGVHPALARGPADKRRDQVVYYQYKTIGRGTRWDCNLNGVTPETEEALVTVVTMDTSAGSVEGLEGVDEELVRQLAKRARAEGVRLTGEGGLLTRLTKVVFESALEGEMDDHLGYAKHDPAGRNGGNSRNGTRSKTLVTDVGPVEIEVPRDRESSFEPVLVGKRGAAAVRDR